MNTSEHAHPDSVALLIGQLKSGDVDAIARLWDRYSKRLVEFADACLLGAPRGAGDGNDVANRAFNDFCSGVRSGSFAKLEDRHDLWRILTTIARHDAANYREHETSQKRGSGRPEELNADIVSLGLGPQVTAEECDTAGHVLRGLVDFAEREIVRLIMDGKTNAEIATELGIHVGRVKRTLERIGRRNQRDERESAGE